MATLTFVYSDSTAVVGPLATVSEPHSWDLCVAHAGRITAPRGLGAGSSCRAVAHHPDEDDLIALADAVREGRDGVAMGAPEAAALRDYSDPVNGGPVGAEGTVRHRRPPSNRRGPARGHLRVLPDPVPMSKLSLPASPRGRTARLATNSRVLD